MCLNQATVSYCIVIVHPTAPTEIPQNIRATIQSSRSITLLWEPPSLEEQNGLLVQYHVIVTETQILYLDNGTLDSPMGDNFNRTYEISEGRIQLIDLLHPSYNYTVRIAAATVVGIGPFSNPITVMTLEDGEYYILPLIHLFLFTIVAYIILLYG